MVKWVAKSTHSVHEASPSTCPTAYNQSTVSPLAMTMSAEQTYTINAFWDADAEVWVATSEDVIGLVTESATIELLTEKLHTLIPELIQLNHRSPAGGLLNGFTSERPKTIDFELITRRQESIQIAA
jgi:Domain of unknown function (DUF1902)